MKTARKNLVPVDLLENFTTDLFRAVGVPDDDARLCADVLITADKRGIDTHGVARLKTIYYDRIVHHRIQEPVTRLEIVRDRAATALVDGHHGMGMVIAARCMRMAMDKARRHGIGIVAARNSTHYGIAGYYVLMACRENMIGITGTNARPSVAPTFGVENMLGTNPLVFGIPTDEDFAFTNDYATSIIQRGKIEQAAREGRRLPPGLVITRDGGTATDPEKILAGLISGAMALVPLGGIGEDTGGYKGYGFATTVELLCCALQDGAALKDLSGFDRNGRHVPHRLGHFFIAVDISFFTEPARFRRTAGDVLRRLRASQRAPEAERIFTAGEKEHLAWLERRRTGIPLSDQTCRELVAMRDEQGLSNYRFPFEDETRQ